MSILAEYGPELCLREFNTFERLSEECLPEILEIGKTYPFLKKGQKHYWIKSEIALRKTKGNQQLSRPIASIIILGSTHFLKDKEVWTKGTYKVIETYDINNPTIHFETTEKINNPDNLK